MISTVFMQPWTKAPRRAGHGPDRKVGRRMRPTARLRRILAPASMLGKDIHRTCLFSGLILLLFSSSCIVNHMQRHEMGYWRYLFLVWIMTGRMRYDDILALEWYFLRFLLSNCSLALRPCLNIFIFIHGQWGQGECSIYCLCSVNTCSVYPETWPCVISS